MKIFLMTAFVFFQMTSVDAQNRRPSFPPGQYCFFEKTGHYQNGHGSFEIEFWNRPRDFKLSVYAGQGSQSSPWHYRYVLGIPNVGRDIYSPTLLYTGRELSEGQFNSLNEKNPTAHAPFCIRIEERNGDPETLVEIQQNRQGRRGR